jgi:ferredoxin
MDNEEGIYRALQQHLDRQAVGYPATKSGAEIRILKRFFNPQEASLALQLSYKPTSVDHIYESAQSSGIAFDAMESMLEGMVKNGVIGHKLNKEGARCFFTLPFVVGMFEGQLNKLTPEFLADVEKYTTNKAFGLAFLSTELPQMRTIPVGKSISVEHHVTTYDHLTDIINKAEGPFAIHECMCRKLAAIKGNPCQKTSRLETCMAMGEIAKNSIATGMGRAISRQEALEITELNEADGLVLQPSNTQKINFVCACCGCCCGMLSMQKMLPKPVDFWAANFYASVDAEACKGCGKCVKRCQLNAVSINDKLGISQINLDRCIGCGNCVVSCKPKAMSLLEKKKHTVPPESSEDLYNIIMANKKGTFGKLKVALKLVLKM